MGFGAKLCAEANQRDSALAVSHLQQRRLLRKVFLTVQPAARSRSRSPYCPTTAMLPLESELPTAVATPDVA